MIANLKKNDGILLQDSNEERSIYLVNDFGYLTIEYYDEEHGAITLADSDLINDPEMIDIYNNCIHKEDFLKNLLDMKLAEMNN